MLKVRDYYNYINEWAPFDTAVEYDNVGLLSGDIESEVTGVILALDITLDVIEEAVKEGANLIISHHPIIFGDGLKQVSYSNASGKISYELARNSLNAICAHTNLDMAQGGVSDCLAEAIGLKNIKTNQDNPFLRAGELSREMDIAEFTEHVRAKTGAQCIQLAGSAPGLIKNVAVAGGSAGNDFMSAQKMYVDILLSGEAKHSAAIAAGSMGFCFMIIGHHYSEVVVLPKMLSYLQKCTSGVQSIGTIRITCAKTLPFEVL